MGLAPMHTWLPDAHSEAPPVVSSLLSGALLNCAFLGLFRGHAVLAAAELGHFSGGLLVLFGLLSMSLAALFMIGQTDFKRMLAYSSIEHMGILALGAGLGGLAATGAMLHAVGHSAAKSLLFLTAGNLVAVYRTKNIREVRGALRGLPVSGCLWLAGFLAIAGAPPFGLFLSELTILRGAIDGGHWTAAALFLAALGVACTAMAGLVLPMVFGSPVFPAEGGAGPCGAAREPAWAVAPPLALGLAVLALGLYVPGPLWDTLREAAAVGGR
jgi:hydrogenase-4 component F